MEPAAGWQQQLMRIGMVVVLSLFIVMIWIAFQAGQFRIVMGESAAEYAELARNLAEGHGYTTQVIRPMTLVTYPHIDHHPEVGTAPVHPWIASRFMRAMSDKGRALVLSCGLAFLLGVPVIFFLGWQLFDMRTGILATVLYVTNWEYLRLSISGLEASWVMLWVGLLFLTCFTLSRKVRWRLPLAAAAGVLVALIYLTQYMWGVILPLVAVYIYLSTDRRGRWLAVLVFLLGWGVAQAPWCVRTYNVTGHLFYNFNGLGVIAGTRSNPGNTIFRQATSEFPSWVWYLVARPREVIQKVTHGLDASYASLSHVAGYYVTPFFLVGILVALGSQTFERLRALWYAMFVVLLLAMVASLPVEGMLAPLGPVAGVIAVGFFLRLLETRIRSMGAQTGRRYLFVGIGTVVLLNLLPLIYQYTRDRSGDEEQWFAIARGCEEVASMGNGPIVTDVPWYVAWYANRPAIWLPKTRVDLNKIENRLGKIPWMLLSTQVINPRYDLAERTMREWGVAYEEARTGDIEFEGYRVQQRIAAGGMSFMLFKADPTAKQDLSPEVIQHYAPALGAGEQGGAPKKQ